MESEEVRITLYDLLPKNPSTKEEIELEKKIFSAYHRGWRDGYDIAEHNRFEEMD